jgi:hypothetical protein
MRDARRQEQDIARHQLERLRSGDAKPCGPGRDRVERGAGALGQLEAPWGAGADSGDERPADTTEIEHIRQGIHAA